MQKLPWIDYEPDQDSIVVHNWPIGRIDRLKALGLMWFPKDKTWEALYTDHLYASLAKTCGDEFESMITPRLRKYANGDKPVLDEDGKNIIQVLDTLDSHEIADRFIREEYGWECPIKGISLFLHQKQAWVLGVEFPRVGFFLDMGLGKTIISATILDYLLKQGTTQKVLVCCLASNVSTWEEELARVPFLKGKVADLREGPPTKSQVVHLSSHELLIHRTKWFYAQGYDTIIIDEVAAFKNPMSKRSKVAYQLSLRAKRFIGLTGTPFTKGLSDIFGIMKVIDLGKRFGTRKWGFQHRYFYDDGYKFPKWYVKPGADQEIIDIMSGCSMRRSKEECLDLPERIFIKRGVKLTKEQLSHYRELLDALSDSDLGSAKSFMSTMGYFQRISSGYLDRDGSGWIDSSKLASLVDMFEEMAPDDKAIIWCRLQASVERVKSALDKAGIKTVQYFGDMDKKAYEKARGTLEKDPTCRAIIMTLAKGSRGLTLNMTNYSIYYELDYDYEDYIQSLDRNYRIGQKQKVTVVHLYSQKTVDESILKAVEGSFNLHQSVTNAISTNQKELLKNLLKGKTD